MNSIARRTEPVFGIPEIEINEIYLPICERILSWSEIRNNIENGANGPFVIGVTGSVAVGKTTVAKALKEIFEGAPFVVETEIVSTDNFLFPNETLDENRILHRKGFPESFDYSSIINFLKALGGNHSVKIPIYSHETYDIIESTRDIHRDKILILEGVNILQNAPRLINESNSETIRDFIGFSIYLDAAEATIKTWYTDRFLNYCRKAKSDSESFFHQFKEFSEDQARELAAGIWETINSPNLQNHIAPSISFADSVLLKEMDHSISQLQVPSEWLSI